MGPRIEPLWSQCPHITKHPHRSANRIWLPGTTEGKEMSDPQAQVGISWRSHQQNEQQSLDCVNNQGKKPYSVFGENIKLIATDKFYSILSFNWKEESLLKKKLSFLESLKKYEANAWLTEQKAFYKRCHLKLQRSELAHARLLGNKDLVKQLTSKNMLSNYTPALVDESEAAVKAIVQKRGEWEKRALFVLSLEQDTLCLSLRDGLQQVEGQAGSRAPLNSKKGNVRTAVKTRSLSREAHKPSPTLSLGSVDSTELQAQQRKLPVDSRSLQESDGAMKDSSGGTSSILESHLQDPATDRTSRGKFLKYIVYGNNSALHPKKKRSRP